MKVLVIFSGGTLIMKKDGNGVLKVPPKAEALQSIRELSPRIGEVAEIDLHFFANIDSTNMHPDYWNELSSVIYEHYDEYDGFVITHGTDSMAYTSSALSFSLQGIGKPVVLTGSQIPGTEIDTDARMNFVNAVQLACQDVSGVYVCFGERIILGCRAHKVSESRLDAFISVNELDVGYIAIDMKLTAEARKRHSHEWSPQTGFEHDVMVVTLTPGADPFDLAHMLEADRLKGLIIQGYGSGNIPYEYGKVFEKALEKKVPVLVNTQCTQGKTSMAIYDVGQRALDAGVIECYDMSLEAAVTKLMWVISHYEYDEVKKAFHTDVAGEIKLHSDANRIWGSA